MVIKIMMETPLGNSVRQAIETSDEEKVSPRGHHFSMLVQPTNQGVQVRPARVRALCPHLCRSLCFKVVFYLCVSLRIEAQEAFFLSFHST